MSTTVEFGKLEMMMQMMDMPMSMGMPMMCCVHFCACFPARPAMRAAFSDLTL